MLRVVTGQIFHEGNSFTSLLTEPEDFIVLKGDDLFTLEGSGSMLGGILTECTRSAVYVIPSIAVCARPGGPVRQSVFNAFSQYLTDIVQQEQPDIILLDLHGAMITTALDDPEGKLLETLRQIVPEDTVIAAGLDLHGHVTDMMLNNSDIITACKHNPHSDFFETGVKAARLAIDKANGLIDPITVVARLPMLTAGNNETHTGPLREAHDLALRALADHQEILDVSIFNVMPLIDVQNMAQVVLIIADKNVVSAKEAALNIVSCLWSRRTEFVNDFPSIEQVLDRITQSRDDGPFVISDFGDRVLAGAPGDSTEILQAALNHQPRLSGAIPITDARAVKIAKAAGVGSQVQLNVGGWATQGATPVEITGTVTSLLDGNFTMKGPAHAGQKASCGDVAIISLNTIKIILTTKAAYSQDINFFEQQGIRIKEQDFVVVKSGNHFQLSFEGKAKPIKAATSGVGVYIPGKFKIKRKPIYPETEEGISQVVVEEFRKYGHLHD